MNHSDRSKTIDRIIDLAVLKNTGHLGDLAEKLDISPRTVKRIIAGMRDDGIPIRFDRRIGSYVLD